jgi:hypothetical protein
VIPLVLPVDPFLLDKLAFQAKAGCYAGDLAGVIGLNAADGDERVAGLGEGVWDEVFEFAGFVAAAGDGRVEVVAFGVDLGGGGEGSGDVLWE